MIGRQPPKSLSSAQRALARRNAGIPETADGGIPPVTTAAIQSTVVKFGLRSNNNAELCTEAAPIADIEHDDSLNTRKGMVIERTLYYGPGHYEGREARGRLGGLTRKESSNYPELIHLNPNAYEPSSKAHQFARTATSIGTKTHETISHVFANSHAIEAELLGLHTDKIAPPKRDVYRIAGGANANAVVVSDNHRQQRHHHENGDRRKRARRPKKGGDSFYDQLSERHAYFTRSGEAQLIFSREEEVVRKRERHNASITAQANRTAQHLANDRLLKKLHAMIDTRNIDALHAKFPERYDAVIAAAVDFIVGSIGIDNVVALQFGSGARINAEGRLEGYTLILHGDAPSIPVLVEIPDIGAGRAMTNDFPPGTLVIGDSEVIDEARIRKALKYNVEQKDKVDISVDASMYATERNALDRIRSEHGATLVADASGARIERKSDLSAYDISAAFVDIEPSSLKSAHPYHALAPISSSVSVLTNKTANDETVLAAMCENYSHEMVAHVFATVAFDHTAEEGQYTTIKDVVDSSLFTSTLVDGRLRREATLAVFLMELGLIGNMDTQTNWSTYNVKIGEVKHGGDMTRIMLAEAEHDYMYTSARSITKEEADFMLHYMPASYTRSIQEEETTENFVAVFNNMFDPVPNVKHNGMPFFAGRHNGVVLLEPSPEKHCMPNTIPGRFLLNGRLGFSSTAVYVPSGLSGVYRDQDNAARMEKRMEQANVMVLRNGHVPEDEISPITFASPWRQSELRQMLHDVFVESLCASVFIGDTPIYNTVAAFVTSMDPSTMTVADYIQSKRDIGASSSDAFISMSTLVGRLLVKLAMINNPTSAAYQRQLISALTSEPRDGGKTVAHWSLTSDTLYKINQFIRDNSL